MNKKLVSTLLATVLAAFLLSFSGCGTGVLIGNVKPVDQKSDAYGVMDLSKNSAEWTKLDPKAVDTNPTSQDAATTTTEISDVAFQSKKTASIISLSSACRHSRDYEDKDLQTLTNTLLLGSSDVTLRDEKDLSLNGVPALQTTIEGKINGEEVKLRAVVIKRQTCVYDLVFVARPKTFDSNVEDFSHFVASLRLK
jgi:hypothetical protein